VRAEPAAGKKQRGDHGAKLPDQRGGHHHPEGRLGAELGQDVEALEAEHHADEDARNGDDQYGQHADGEDLLQQQARPSNHFAAAAQDREQQQVAPSQTPGRGDSPAAELCQGVDHAGSPSRSLSSVGAGK